MVLYLKKRNRQVSMHSFLVRTIIVATIAISGIAPRSYAAAEPNPVEVANKYLQMRLTHTLFEGVTAKHFAEQGAEFNAAQLADRAYLQTFLNVWSKMIETGKYRSTSEILSKIKSNGGYLARYAEKWNGVRSWRQSEGKINFGGMVEQFLDATLRTEDLHRDLEERIQKILYFDTVYLVMSSEEHDLARLIAEPFSTAGSAGTQAAAQDVLRAIPFEKKANVAVMAWNALSLFFGGAAAGGIRIANLIRVPRFFAVSTPNVRSLGGLGARMFARAINPIVRKPKLIHWSALASAGLHGGAAGILLARRSVSASPQHANDAAAVTANALAISALWDKFNSV